MKILHVYKRSYPDSFGGVEQFIHQLSLATSNLGHDNHVLSLTKNSPLDLLINENYQISRLKEYFEISSTGFSISFLKKFKSIYRGFDIIQLHFPWPFYDLIHLLMNVEVPLIITYHSDIVKQKKLYKFYEPVQSRLLSRAKAIVCTSQNYLDTSEVLSNYSDKTYVIPIGLDLETYPKVSSEKLNYWSSHLPRKFFLFVGVLRYYKGLKVLIEACRGTDLKVVILGSGPEERELKQKINENNNNSIIFLGQLSEEDKVAIIKLSYGVVCPSNIRSEAFGISLLEGLMFEKPLVSCSIGTGTSFVNINGFTGHVVPPNNANLLRSALGDLWDNEKMAEEFSRNSLLHYQRNFTAGAFARAYIDLYKMIYKK